MNERYYLGLSCLNHRKGRWVNADKFGCWKFIILKKKWSFWLFFSIFVTKNWSSNVENRFYSYSNMLGNVLRSSNQKSLSWICLSYKMTNSQHPNLSALTHLPSLWYEQRLKMFFLKLVPFCKFSAFNFFFRFRLRLLSIQVAPIVHFINKTLSTLKSHYSHNNPKCSDRTFFPPSHNTRDFPQCTWTVFWKGRCRNTVFGAPPPEGGLQKGQFLKKSGCTQ